MYKQFTLLFAIFGGYLEYAIYDIPKFGRIKASTMKRKNLKILKKSF
jgi:hypothetical protein